jgi:hypothetical protein
MLVAALAVLGAADTAAAASSGGASGGEPLRSSDLSGP